MENLVVYIVYGFAITFAAILYTIYCNKKVNNAAKETLRLKKNLSTLESEEQRHIDEYKKLMGLFLQKNNDIAYLQEKYNGLEEEIKEEYEEKMSTWIAFKEEEIRKDSLKRSRSVIRGQATEHLAPLTMPGLNIKDFRFLGNPIDYIVFSGASDVTDKVDDVDFEKIILLEIKSGKSRLNKVQRRIRDAVKNGNVEFVIYNPDTQETKTITSE